MKKTAALRNMLIIAMLVALILPAAAGCTEKKPKTVQDKEISFTLNGQDYTAVYSGEWAKGKAEGLGTAEIAMPDGSTLIYSDGQFKNGIPVSGCVEGLAYTMEFAGFSSWPGTYSGEVKGLTPSGEGTFTVSGRLQCTGTFDALGLVKGSIENVMLEFYAPDGIGRMGNFSGEFDAGMPLSGSYSSAGTEFVIGTLEEWQCKNASFKWTEDPEGDAVTGLYKGDALLTAEGFVPDGEGVFTAEDASLTYSGKWSAGVFSGGA